MKKMTLIAAGFLVVSTTGLMAQDSKPADKTAAQPAPQAQPAQPATPAQGLQPLNQEQMQKLMKMTPDQRREYFAQHPELRSPGARPDFMKGLGINPEELRSLPPTERRAKIQEAFAKKADELSKKKTAGTITPEEQQILNHLEMMKNATNRPIRMPHAPENPPAGAEQKQQ